MSLVGCTPLFDDRVKLIGDSDSVDSDSRYDDSDTPTHKIDHPSSPTGLGDGDSATVDNDNTDDTDVAGGSDSDTVNSSTDDTGSPDSESPITDTQDITTGDTESESENTTSPTDSDTDTIDTENADISSEVKDTGDDTGEDASSETGDAAESDTGSVNGCSPISEPENGLTTTTLGSDLGSVATHQCNPGFKLEGDESQICESGGWTGSTPVCTNIDDCEPDSCVNGECLDDIGSFVCQCNGNWDGKRCDTCKANYYGSTCDNYCSAEETCSGNGTCNDAGECECSGHWSGASCSTCETNYYGSSCSTYCVASEHCNGRGTCNENGKCDCQAPWDGLSCQTCIPGLVASDDGSSCETYCDLRKCWTIPPTGQTHCYNELNEVITCPSFPCTGESAYCGQDAQYPDASRIFERRTVGTDVVLDDSLTGLMWADVYESDVTWAEAKAYCETDLNSEGYAGYDSGWRLPTLIELLSIVDYEGENPYPPVPETFSTMIYADFWALDICKDNPTEYWQVDFRYGLSQRFASEATDWVRCVRGDSYAENAPERFDTSDASGETLVHDQATGLMWQQDTAYLEWIDIFDYCETSQYGGFTDWRVPNIHELSSLINTERGQEDMHTDFPGMTPFDGYSAKNLYWSSTTWTFPTTGVTRVVMGRFESGALSVGDKEDSYSLRCVRDE